MKKYQFQWVLIAVLTLFLGAACSRKSVNIQTMTPEEQIEYAKGLFNRKKYYDAKAKFTIIVMNNQGNVIIEEAQYYLAETYFAMKDYVLAIEEYEKLIRSLPKSQYVDDAYYKVGLCYFKLSPGYALDQEYTVKAIDKFEQFLYDFPDSEWAGDVKEKLAKCKDKLAKKEFKTGELYRKMSYYPAAIISYDFVIDQYSESQYVAAAMYWKGECYRKMMQWQQAEEAYNTLVTTFPEDSWALEARQQLDVIKNEPKPAPTEESQTQEEK